MLLTLLLGASLGRAADDPGARAFFEAKIRPVLVERCYQCHSAKAEGPPKGGFRLDTREGLRRGGDSGPAVVPGNLEESLLVQAIEHAGDVPKMPPKGKKLPEAVIADFRAWIQAGATDPRDGSASPAPAGRDWWSLRPIGQAPIPREETGRARTPIDAFVLAELRAKGLTLSLEADRRTLIRRATFDLIGLPPTPEEVEAFLADPAADAYERLVDRLLASPHYGERWARHWMDVVHFAETHGHDQDRIRENAWPYRDYLVRAFNEDRPYARFVEEQLAADALFPDDPGLVVALGFIAAGPWDESSLRDIREDSIDRQIGHYIDRDDMVSTAMSTFVSSTVHCARCHDHKFDPISQQDYYSLQAVFAGVDRAERAYDFDRRLAQIRKVVQPERWGLLPQGQLVYAGASVFKPDAGHKPPKGPRPVYVLKRGDIHSPGEPAAPGTLSCVEGLPARFDLPDPNDEAPRRAALAKWISDPRNPLTWRSIVNRVWHYHFGRGLVDTPNDFGRMGSRPSHPELLDWLAARFRDGGGSTKELNRVLVTSAVYRQASGNVASAARIDADNRLLWRMTRSRVDAESLRDAVLQVSGRLDTTMGGPSVQHFALSPGVHVTPVVDYTKFDWDTPGAGRRSVYRFLFRTLPDPFMDSLDCADASHLTAARNVSVTPLQALALLNDRFILRHSEHFARRLESGRSDLEGRIRMAYELALGRPPEPDELRSWTEYAAKHGLENVCRLLLNSNEFLFVN
jgi:cytochrome c553